MSDSLKNWIMLALTLTFIALYGAALTGWLKPLSDERVITRLEPLIFVIIGYYFGRMPARQNEKTLMGEIGRLMQKADAAQHAKERAQQYREALEEKVKNARVALTASGAASMAMRGTQAGLEKANTLDREAALRGSVVAALGILDS